MEGGGTRVFTKQGKLKKVKKPKKEKKRKGVGPQTFVKKQEIEIPKNEIIEVPKPRGRPRKEPAFVPFVFNPPPPKPPRPKKEKTEEEKVEELGEMLGEKYQPALNYFKQAPDAEQDKILEKTLKARARKGASSVGGDYGSFTANDLSAAKQRWQKLRLYVKTLAETERYKEQEDLRKKGEIKFGQTIETPLTNLLENREEFKPRILSASEAKNLGIKPPKPRRGKSLERAEPKPKPAENPLDLADQPKKRGRPPKEPEQKKTPPPLPPRTKKEEPKKKGPPLPARPPQVSPPLTFPQLDKPAKAKRGRPKKEPEPEQKKTPPPLPPRKRIQKDISVSSEPLAPLKLPQDLQPEIYGTPKKSPRPKLLKIPPTPPEEKERRKKVEAEAIKARSPKKPEKPPTPKLLKSPKPKVTAVEAEKTELLQELKAEVSPKLKPKVEEVQELDSEDEDEHDAETAALYAKLPKQRPTAEVAQPKITPTKEERKKAMEERKAAAAAKKEKAAKAKELSDEEEEQDEEDAALFAKLFSKRPAAEIVEPKITPTKEERKAAADARIAEAARKKKEQEGVERRKAKFLADRAKAEAARAEAAAKYAEEQAGIERRKAKFLADRAKHIEKQETKSMGEEDILSTSVRNKEKAKIEAELKRIQEAEKRAAEKKARADAKAAADLKKIQEAEAEAKAKEERLAEIARKKAEAAAKEAQAKADKEADEKRAKEAKAKINAKREYKAYKDLQEITEDAKREYVAKLKKEKEAEERADLLLGLKKAGKYGDRQLEKAKAKAAEAQAEAEQAKQAADAETKQKAGETITTKLKAVKEGKKVRTKLAKVKEQREGAFGDLQLKALQAKAEQAGKEARQEEIRQSIEARQLGKSKQPTLPAVQKTAEAEREQYRIRIDKKQAKVREAKEAQEKVRADNKGKRDAKAKAARETAKANKAAAEEELRIEREKARAAEKIRIQTEELAIKADRELRKQQAEEASMGEEDISSKELQGVRKREDARKIGLEKSKAARAAFAKTVKEQAAQRELQAKTKAAFLAKLEEIKLEEEKDASIKLQALARQYLTAQAFKSKKEATKTIQTLVRTNLAMKKLKELKSENQEKQAMAEEEEITRLYNLLEKASIMSSRYELERLAAAEATETEPEPEEEEPKKGGKRSTPVPRGKQVSAETLKEREEEKAARAAEAAKSAKLKEKEEAARKRLEAATEARRIREAEEEIKRERYAAKQKKEAEDREIFLQKRREEGQAERAAAARKKEEAAKKKAAEEEQQILANLFSGGKKKAPKPSSNPSLLKKITETEKEDQQSQTKLVEKAENVKTDYDIPLSDTFNINGVKYEFFNRGPNEGKLFTNGKIIGKWTKGIGFVFPASSPIPKSIQEKIIDNYLELAVIREKGKQIHKEKIDAIDAEEARYAALSQEEKDAEMDIRVAEANKRREEQLAKMTPEEREEALKPDKREKAMKEALKKYGKRVKDLTKEERAELRLRVEALIGGKPDPFPPQEEAKPAEAKPAEAPPKKKKEKPTYVEDSDSDDETLRELQIKSEKKKQIPLILQKARLPPNTYDRAPADFKQMIDAEAERLAKILVKKGSLSKKEIKRASENATDIEKAYDLFRGETEGAAELGLETPPTTPRAYQGARNLAYLQFPTSLDPTQLGPETPRESQGKGLHKRLPYGRAKGMGDLSDGDVESQDGGGSDQEEKLSHYTYIMPSSPILRRGFKHPAMVSPGMSDHLHPNAAANIHAFSGGLLGRGRSRSPSPDDMGMSGCGMGMSGCGSMKDKMGKMYKKAVPKSLRPAVEELGKEAVDYAVNSKKVKGMRQDAKEKYEKTVPKSLRPAVAELAKDTGNFAKRQSGFGLKKGSEAARKFMAELRARKGKKMKGGVIPSPPSRSPITDASLL